MTQQMYGPPPRLAPSWHAPAKALLAAVMVLLGAAAAAIAAFIAHITYTGCFISCDRDGGQEGYGLLLGALALALLAAGPGLAVVMWRTARTTWRIMVWSLPLGLAVLLTLPVVVGFA